MHKFRPRRNRNTKAIRSLVQENHLLTSDLIYPLFLLEGEKRKEGIKSLPHIFRYSLDYMLKEIEKVALLKIPAIALFPVIAPEKKDLHGSEALNPSSTLQTAIRQIKKEFPHLCIISDVALDPYTKHAHDGVVDEEGNVLNDQTVDILKKIALVQAEAGVDMIAPSDMMDSRIGAIREELDDNGFTYVNIHAYCAKYASAFYGPFRDALSSQLKKGDKKSYQMNPANRREALLEGKLDELEGADILMVKPALHYLDVIAALRQKTILPISAYHVSGEYAMLMAACQNGWVEKRTALFETLISIKRAGADMIFTYAALEVAEWIKNDALD